MTKSRVIDYSNQERKCDVMFWLWLICLIVSIIGIVTSNKYEKYKFRIVMIILLISSTIYGIIAVIPRLMFALSDWQF